jgi:hypothetical protein
MIVRVAVGFDVPQKLEFVQSLIEEILVVLNHLEACHFLIFGAKVLDLDDFGEDSVAENFLNLVPTCDDVAFLELELFLFFITDHFAIKHDFQFHHIKADIIVLKRIVRVLFCRKDHTFGEFALLGQFNGVPESVK